MIHATFVLVGLVPALAVTNPTGTGGPFGRVRIGVRANPNT